ncbi:hypothetical protein C7212DRAFT_358875 [Tuber magnatum]|uniref:Uncharacterized protein n=1 Tax=Tuber magnatum TaxID=42249 RepID=A0A317SJG6_9PEZI|nr:hypothetical protein C7212DRAFT_358875 [Tuber magnatum]
MSAIIRLRPNRIVLTSDEVRSLHPRSANVGGSASTPSPAAILAWDHNITRRRARARASRRYCAEALDLYAPELEEGSDGSVKILEDEDVRGGWSRVGGGEGDGRDGVALEGSGDALILPLADVGVGGMQVEEGGGVQLTDSDGENASASAGDGGSSDPAFSTLGAGGVDDVSRDFIDIAYLADIDFDPPDSPPPSPPTTEATRTAANARIDLVYDTSTGTTTVELSLTPARNHPRAVEGERLARYRDRSSSGEGAHLRRSGTAAGGFDGDDEKSDSDNDESSEGHDDDGASSIGEGVGEKGIGDVGTGTQTEKVEEGEPPVSSSRKREKAAATTTAKSFR